MQTTPKQGEFPICFWQSPIVFLKVQAGFFAHYVGYLISWTCRDPETRFLSNKNMCQASTTWHRKCSSSCLCVFCLRLVALKGITTSVAQSELTCFHLLVFRFSPLFCHGPKRLTFYFWVLWATELLEVVCLGFFPHTARFCLFNKKSAVKP